MSTKDEKVKEILKENAGRFLFENGNNSSLLTVTNVYLGDRGKYATIMFTVFPDSLEKTALEFAKRKRGEFRDYLKDHSRLGLIPHIDFEIDMGEKNRQKIDDLLNK